ncbi:MAG TPA: MAPEG family protein [Sphingomonas sp.]|nr:MAPEG family protein [Sphingomonas sp.]
MGIAALPITLVTAGGAALIALWLAIRTGRARRAAGVSIGDGGDERLRARMRAQANYVESAPFILILIGLIETTEGPSLWLWAASVVFLLARVAHPFGMDGIRYCRTVGATVTMVLLLGLGLYAVLTPLTAPATRPATIVGPSQG